MSWYKYVLYPGILALTFGVELFRFSLAVPQIRRQSQLVSISFPPASNRGAPSRTAGGGQRGGDCVSRENPPLTVLAPSDNVGTTVSANPSLFWYVPQTQAKSAAFTIFDEEEDEVYQTNLALKGVPGVVKMSLPKTVSLEPGKRYQWVLMLQCDSSERVTNQFVFGHIERTELSMADKTKLAAAKESMQQAEVYAQAKIWQETVTLMAQLRRDRPNDPTVIAAWKELLTSVGLDAIANEPMVECCTAEPN